MRHFASAEMKSTGWLKKTSEWGILSTDTFEVGYSKKENRSFLNEERFQYVLVIIGFN